MPFPLSTITSGASAVGYRLFQVGLNLYVFTQGAASGGTAHLQVWKSTDSGLTWTEMDSVNEPVVSRSTINGNIDACCDGAVIYGFSYNTGVPQPQISLFDTGTDTWGVTVLGNLLPHGFQAVNSISLVYRASNNQIVGLGSNSFGTSFTSGCYFVFDIGSLLFTHGWVVCGPSAVSNDVNTSQYSACYGASKTIFTFTVFLTGGLGTNPTVFYQTLSDTNVLSGVVMLDANPASTSLVIPTVQSDGTNVVITWMSDFGLHPNRLWIYESLASALSFVKQIVTVPPANTAYTVVISGVYYCFLIGNADNLLYLGADAGAGFGVFTALGSTGGSAGAGLIVAFPLTFAAVGLMTTDSSIVDFGTFVTPIPPVTPSPIAIIANGGGNTGVLPVSLPDPQLHCKWHRPATCDRNNRVIMSMKTASYPSGFVTNRG